MSIYTCALCNKNIPSFCNIYYAYDNNYCSEKCRYISLSKNDNVSKTLYDYSYDYFYDYFLEKDYKYNSKNHNINIKNNFYPHLKCKQKYYENYKNLTSIDSTNNIILSYNNPINKKEKICNSYLEYSLSYIRSIYNIFYYKY